jgi:two-component system cell cycle response regulator
MGDKKKILIVDEELSYRELLREALGANYRVIDTGSCSEAAHLAGLNTPDLIIIDVEASGRKGVELCETLKEDPETRDIPVILITSLAKKDDIILGLQVGASDYIIKPMCLPEVLARIESHLRTQEDYAELEHKDLLMLLELSETMSVTRSPNAILQLIVNKMSKIMDVARCSIISVTDGRKVSVKASSDLDNNTEIKLDLNRYPEIRKAIETKQAVAINDIKTDPVMASVREYLQGLEYNSIVVIPLIKKESVIGTFFLRTVSHERGWVSERIFKLSQLVANIAANALENAILFESVKTAQEYFEEMSIRDDLTKLFNRRHFYNRLKEEFNRAARHNHPLSLLFIDVDDFKQINDTYGHAVGDKALKEVGSLLKNAARGSDLPARCGGDEFAMILPNTNSAGALELAARISKTIHAHKIEGMSNQKLSTSMGCATFVDGNVTSADALVKLADDAMYRSKAQGKGRVIQA